MFVQTCYYKINDCAKYKQTTILDKILCTCGNQWKVGQMMTKFCELSFSTI